MDRPLYIAGTGVLTAIGNNMEMVYWVSRAGISGAESADYFTHDRKRMVLGLVPDGALPPLHERLDFSGKLSFRDRRILRMSHVAAFDAMQHHLQVEPVPLIFAAPAIYPGVDCRLDQHFISYFQQQTGLPIDLQVSRLNYTGRTGVLDALKQAQHYLYDAGYQYVLIGGADSYQHSGLLQLLDSTARVKAQRVYSIGSEDNFVPGEGAGFLLMTHNPQAALQLNGRRIRIAEPGFGLEPGHLYSDEPNQGAGLDQAFKEALANSPDIPPIGLIYNSMNGEDFWGRELKVALMRSSRHMNEPQIEHPAENYGDIGSATAALLLSLTQRHLLQNPDINSGLVYSAADQSYRAAVCLQSEAVAA